MLLSFVRFMSSSIYSLCCMVSLQINSNQKVFLFDKIRGINEAFLPTNEHLKKISFFVRGEIIFIFVSGVFALFGLAIIFRTVNETVYMIGLLFIANAPQMVEAQFINLNFLLKFYINRIQKNVETLMENLKWNHRNNARMTPP